MKIYKNIFEKIITPEYILRAWDEFKRGKRMKRDVQEFEFRLEDNLFRLHRDLARKQYTHGPYTGFYVRDPKIRHIHKAEVRDRIVHHLLFMRLNPIFEPSFIADSYSARIQKGTHKGVECLTTFCRKVLQTHGRCFVLKCDIRKFFPTIDHEILLSIISRKIKDQDALWLIKSVLQSFSSKRSENSSRGVPLGNLTSQLFANIYMNEFDQFMKQDCKVKYYIRYTDDFVIVHQDRNYLLNLKQKISEFLNAKLKLSLHPNKVTIRAYHQGIDFLGYVNLPHSRVLRTKTRKRIFKKLAQRVKEFRSGIITEEKLLRSFDSYLGALRHANSYQLEQELRNQFWEWARGG